MRFTVDFLGLCLDIQFGPISAPGMPDAEQHGSTCGVLERTPAWDHDNRPPVGFAGSIRPMPNPYGKSKET